MSANSHKLRNLAVGKPVAVSNGLAPAPLTKPKDYSCAITSVRRASVGGNEGA